MATTVVSRKTATAIPRPLSRVLQLMVLAALLVVVGLFAFQFMYSILDLDIWWHLKVGDWIIQHRGFPHTGIFSRTAADRPWAAYSWLYEVWLSLAYRWSGLLGIAIYGTALTLGVAYSVYWMVRRLCGRFYLSCLLAVIACSAFLFSTRPRPVFLSMILFSVTLTLVLQANRTGQIQLLYWLPPIFLLWANVHIQFVYGIFLIGLLLATNLAQRIAARFRFAPAWLLPPTLPVGQLAAVVAACVLATCIGPYGWHLYQIVYGYAHTKVAYTLVSELQPIDFRSYTHYLQLLLTGTAFFALGWSRRVDLFKLGLLTVISILAFRALRESWFICIPAIACIADLMAADGEHEQGESWLELAAVGAVVVFVLFLFSHRMEFDEPGITRLVRRNYPVSAVNFIRQQALPGPMYNAFDLGGFLIWALPDRPVSIDGRTDLYGDDFVQRTLFTVRGVSYAEDPYLRESRIIMLQPKSILVKMLAADPHYEMVYSDDLAIVFVPR